MKLLTTILFALINACLCAQELILTDTLHTNSVVTQADCDAYGNLYIGLASGVIEKYDTAFQLKHSFQPQLSSSPKHLQVITPQKIFIFFEDEQRYIFLNRYLKKVAQYNLNIENSWVTDLFYSVDNYLIGVNLNESRLYKLQQDNGTIVFTNDLWVNASINQSPLVYYEDKKIIIWSDNHLHLLDNIGKLLFSTQIQDQLTIFLKGDTLYSLDAKHFNTQNLSGTSKKEIKLQINANEATILVMYSKTSGYIVNGTSIFKVFIQ